MTPPQERPLLVNVLHGTVALARVAATGERQAIPLRGNLLKILTTLVVDCAKDRDTGVSLEELGRRVWGRNGMNEGTVRVEVSRLRRELGVKGALPHAKGDVVWLDPALVATDWWTFLDEVEEGNAEHDPYSASRHFYTAERAFVRSRRDTVESRPGGAALEAARSQPPPHLKDCAERRWDNRHRIVASLLQVGHVDRALLEYEVYEEMLSRDDFFDYADAPKRLAKLGSTPIDPPIDETTVAERVAERRARRLILPADEVATEHREGIREKLEHAQPETHIEYGRRLKASLEWPDVDRLLSLLLKRLVGTVGDYRPQVVVGLGRDGSLVATMLGHALLCRLQGWVAVSRYQYGRSHERRSYVRAVELPLVRPSRVLLVDDLLFSGKSTRAAIDAVRKEYPDAQVVVAALLNDSSHPERDPLEGVDFVAGLDYPISNKALWVEFPWEKSRLTPGP